MSETVATFSWGKIVRNSVMDEYIVCHDVGVARYAQICHHATTGKWSFFPCMNVFWNVESLRDIAGFMESLEREGKG